MMKKCYSILTLFLLTSIMSNAQNTFPTPTGNVGIGTTSPTKLLEVNGEAMFYGKSLIKRQGASETQNFIWFSDNAFNDQGYIGYFNTNHFRFKTYTDRLDFVTNTVTTPNMTLLNNGNVGIGFDNPLERLHVNGSIRGAGPSGALRVQTNDGYIDIGAQNEFFAHIYSDRPKTIFNNEIVTSGNKISSYNDDLQFKTGSLERMRLDYDTGNVGIGRTDPSAQLDVYQDSATDWAAIFKSGAGSGKGVLIQNAAATTDPSLLIKDNYGNDRFLVRSNGDVLVHEKLFAGADPAFISHNTRAYFAKTLSEAENSGYAMMNFLSTKTAENATVSSWDKASVSAVTKYDIPATSTDNGFKVGIEASAYSAYNDFKGNLGSTYGLWANSGIKHATPGASITNATGVYAEVFDDIAGTTINNIYGVRIYTNRYDAATVNNRYDLYAETASAKNYFAGTVGIGTNNPSNKLHLYNKNASNDEYNTIFDTNSMTFETPTNQASFINKRDGGHLRFRMGASNVDAMIIKSDRSVGIGTLNTGVHKLAVEGSIGAREVKVETTTWSDFVFESDYNLPTLQEVEQHIQEKGHLKDIPSAAEVEKNGIYLGEMDAKLLQKIEELTLYTIAQEKKIKQLEGQEKKITALETQVKELKAINKQLLKLQERLDTIEQNQKK